MNFFYLYRNAIKCARAHGDKHLNKMITEYAQILSFVWYNLVFERINEITDETLKAKVPVLKENMYKKNKSHLKHPVVLWATKSKDHYLAVLELGLALGNEKRRRIDNMVNLPKNERRKWKRYHKSEDTLLYLQKNVPPDELFLQKGWQDPPKCMPVYLHHDAKGNRLSVIESYRLFYAGNKIKVAGLKWTPFVEEPKWLDEYKQRVEKRQDIQDGIASALEERAKKKRKTI